MNIFFIGLGHMGMPMALNLIKAGYAVKGFDLDAAALQRFSAAGGEVASQLSDAYAADVCITMLQKGEQVARVGLDASGRFTLLKPGALYIDCSTIDVAHSRAITAAAILQGVDAVDAPVSGGVKGAELGTLTFMVGGSAAHVERAQTILAAMGKQVIHAGEAGSGQIGKLCNNMILGVSMLAVSEAFNLAQALGLSPQKLHEIVNLASGQCWVMSRYVPVPDVLPDVPANHDYAPGFTSTMMLKDLHLSQEAAKTAAVTTPMGALATAWYTQVNNAGLGHKDFSVIINLLKELSSHA